MDRAAADGGADGGGVTPSEAQAAFLWAITTPWEGYRAIHRMPPGRRAEATRVLAQRLGVSERTVQRRVARYWPVATEPQEPGGLHRIRCTNDPCDCEEVLLV